MLNLNGLLEKNWEVRNQEEFEWLEWIMRTLREPMLRICAVMAAFSGWDTRKDRARPFGCVKYQVKEVEQCCGRKTAFDILWVMNEVDTGLRAVLLLEQAEKLIVLGCLYRLSRMGFRLLFSFVLAFRKVGTFLSRWYRSFGCCNGSPGLLVTDSQ
jgi:hypothetical protein